MTTDPIVTHADLEPLRCARTKWADGSAPALVLDRLIAAAEADAPPLPEVGWVTVTRVTHAGDNRRAYWHRGGGELCDWIKGAPVARIGDPNFRHDQIAPLRPTITEADFRAAVKAHNSMRFANAEDCISAAFAAAGVVIEP